MKPILYAENETTFTTNGFGRLSDAISCKVTEERNGEYELVAVYPVDGIHFTDISERMILYAIHDDRKDRQPFRIYEISKPLNGLVTIRARHVSYDLNKIVVSPFTAGSCAAAIAGVKSNSASTNPFTFATDKQVEASFSLEVPSACRSILGGTEGSILDVFGAGEYEWDGWSVYLHLHRGVDTDISIRYGKNLTALEDTVNVANTYNAVYPYWKGEEENSEGNYVTRIVYISDDPTQRVLNAVVRDENNNVVTLTKEVVPLDLSDQWKTPPTQAALRTKAESYLSNNTPWVENRNITVSFVALWQTEEYKHNLALLERLHLCDTVNVIHTKLGIKVKKKIIKVVYDVLNERYESMELGDASKSFTSAMKSEITSGLNKVQNDISGMKGLITPRSAINNAIDHATNLIRGGLGGYVVITPNATTGYPEEILIMDEPDKNDAQNVWRFNKNGLAFSSNGYAGPFNKIALTADGQIVATAITTGTMTANIIKAGVLTDDPANGTNGNFLLDLSTGQVKAKRFSVESTNFNLSESGIIQANSAVLSNASATGSFSASRTLHYWTDGTSISSSLPGAAQNPEEWYEVNNTYQAILNSATLSFNKNNQAIGYIKSDTLIRNDNNQEVEDVLALFLDNAPALTFHISDGYVFGINNGLNIFGESEKVFASSLLVWGNIKLRGSIAYEGEGSHSGSVDLRYGEFSDNKESILHIDGGYSATGRKARVVETDNYGIVALTATESCVPLFTDVGSGVIGSDGKCLIFFDPKFRETIDLTHDYQVFLNHSGEEQYSMTMLYGCEKSDEYFTVFGVPGTPFDWIVYARQKDYVYSRLDNMTPMSKQSEPTMSLLEQMADDYIKNYEREVYGQ